MVRASHKGFYVENRSGKFFLGWLICVIIFFALISANFSNSPLFSQIISWLIGIEVLAGVLFFIALCASLFSSFKNSFKNKSKSSNKSKIVKLKQDEKHSKTYILGHLVISFFLSGVLSAIFFLAMFPFLQQANGLSAAEKANIGQINIWRIVVIYGLLTILTSVILISKKTFRSLAVFLIIYWVLGTTLSIYITFSNNQLPSNNNSSSDEFITSRDSCYKENTLINAKNCTFRILRDDGGHGTGFVVKQGFLVTNKHVVENASKVTAWINNGEKELTVWNYDPTIDLAILKMPDSVDVEACRWFDSNQLNIAEELYAIGWPNYPTGDSTVTKGIYSRTNRYEDGSQDIQTDAAINPGNSGGPLVNECGVVGINTSRAEWTDEQSPRVGENMGFALTSSSTHALVDNLITNGNISRGFPTSTYSAFGGQPSYSNNNYTLNVDDIRGYLNQLYSVKASWEQVRGQVDDTKLNALLDSFNRQIDFCRHLVDKLSNSGVTTDDDIRLWEAVVKMSNESADLTYQLNSSYGY